MGTRTLPLWIWVGVLAGGCWGSGSDNDHADAGSDEGGSGGAGGSGGVAGFIGGTGGGFMDGGFGGAGIGAEGGFGGDSGFGGTGGTAGGFCPESNPSCSPMNKEDVCTTLLECDLIPRPPASVSDCTFELDERCADCMSDVAADDGGVVDCVEAAQASCTACTLLTQAPTTEADCLAIAAAQPNLSPGYESCICASCLAEYSACVGDDGCWLVMQCAYEVECTGMSCYAPNTCMAIIDEVGATSISVAIATELGNCSAVTCDGL